jgi:hypothetical protein
MLNVSTTVSAVNGVVSDSLTWFTAASNPTGEKIADLLWLPQWWASPQAMIGFTIFTMVFFEGLAYLLPLALEKFAPGKLHHMAPGGRLLHHLEERDFIYIWWNKLVTAIFVVHYLQWLFHGGQLIKTQLSEITLFNFLVPLPLNYLAYDMIYAPFHRLLHWEPLYPYDFGLIV